MKTLAGLARGRAYYMLDTTVCLDIFEGKTDGKFGEFFKRIGRSTASFLIPLAVENEFGGYLHHNARSSRSISRVKSYLREYGRCEAKYAYPAPRGLSSQTRMLQSTHANLSKIDAYLLYLLKRHGRHADLRLLTSDVQLRLAARKECQRCFVADPRRFKDPTRASQSASPARKDA